MKMGHDLPEYRQQASQYRAEQRLSMRRRRFLQMFKGEACISDNLKKTRQKYLFQGVWIAMDLAFFRTQKPKV